MRTLAAILVVALAGAGCHGNSTPTSPSDSTVSLVAQDLFLGSVSPGGSGFYSFTVTQKLTVGLTLASVTSVATAKVVSAPMTIGLGIPRGVDCAVGSPASAGLGLSAQVTLALDPGIYCARVSDGGGLTEPVNFALRIVQTLTPPTASTTSTTDAFASNLVVGGSTTRSFLLSSPGTITVTFQSASPSAAVFGFGVGLSSGGTCFFTRSTEASASAISPISIAVDPGSYCVSLFDTGKLTQTVSFSISIVRP